LRSTSLYLPNRDINEELWDLRRTAVEEELHSQVGVLGNRMEVDPEEDIEELINH
jgi:hypothetical protein